MPYLEGLDVFVGARSEDFCDDVIVGAADSFHGFAQAAAIILERSQQHTLQHMAQFVTFNLDLVLNSVVEIYIDFNRHFEKYKL